MPEALKKILYVEDDEDIAEITMMTLVDLGGFDVRHCPSGEEALLVLPQYEPQLALMDVMMPTMDGPETLKKMRNLSSGKNLPVIFMTAKAQTHEQKYYLSLGAIGVIVKPFDPIQLPNTILELWSKNYG